MPDDASTNFFDAFKLEAMRADHHGAPSASDQPKRRLVVHNPLPVSVEVYLLTGEWLPLSEPSAIVKPFATWRMSINDDILKARLKFGDGTQSTPFDCAPLGDTHVKTYVHHPTATTFASAFASEATKSIGRLQEELLDGLKDVEVFLQNRPRPAGGDTNEKQEAVKLHHFQNVRDTIKVLAKLSVLPSMVGLVDPAAVWMLLAEPRTVAVYVARSMSPAAGRILKALAEDGIISPDDLAALPELTEQHVCAIIYLHLVLPREVDGRHKLERLRRDALQSYFGSARSKRQVDGKGRPESGDGSQEGKWLGTFNGGNAGGPKARIFGKGNDKAHHVQSLRLKVFASPGSRDKLYVPSPRHWQAAYGTHGVHLLSKEDRQVKLKQVGAGNSLLPIKLDDGKDDKYLGFAFVEGLPRVLIVIAEAVAIIGGASIDHDSGSRIPELLKSIGHPLPGDRRKLYQGRNVLSGLDAGERSVSESFASSEAQAARGRIGGSVKGIHGYGC